MGLEIEAFVDEVAQNLLCPICKKVLEKPSASQCGHVFCSSCLGKAISSKKLICPTCNGTLAMEKTSSAVDELAQQLSKLSMHCTHQSDGCKTVTQLQDLEQHLGTECDYRLVKCEHKGCESLAPFIHLEVHMDSCDYRIVECKVCKVCLPRKDMSAHQAIKRCYEQLNRRRMVTSARRISQELKDHQVDLVRDRHLTEQAERHLTRRHYGLDQSGHHRRAMSAGPVLQRSVQARVGSASVVPHYSRNLKSAAIDSCRGCTNRFTAGRRPSARAHSHLKPVSSCK